MKSLEEVIKYKLNFLPKRINPFYDIQTYTEEREGHERARPFIIYETENAIFFNDSFSLIEDITPLFVYISSCEKYYRENGIGKFSSIHIKSIDENFYENSLCSSWSSDFEVYRISPIKSCEYNHFSRLGFYYRYTKPLTILFKGHFCYNLTEEEEEVIRREEEMLLARGEEEDSDEEEEEDLSINDSRTFKLEQCVICLEKEPKVLFCNCGHICICDECPVKKLNNCPVCKKENTILRMIE